MSIEQQNAIDLLVLGKTDAEVGESVGVSRQSVCDWRNHDALFMVELNRQRQELWGSHKQQLRSLLGRAVQTLADNLESEDKALRQAAAVHVLKATGLYGSQLEPHGPTSGEEVEREWERAAVARKSSENMDRLMAELAGM
ncbi:MAG: hypothetical protein M1144_06510 [Candidatus Thermoplasmatota archaeon]|nr:hypothetical protein [Candidatus Thermoplasmatota archaeon]